MNDNNSELVIAYTSSGTEELAKMIPKALIVVAFQTVSSEVLFGVYEAKRKASRPYKCTAATTRAAKVWPLS